MDADTCFESVFIGEEIVAKYRYGNCVGLFQTVSILTNLRILTRWQSGLCRFCSRSTYSSIVLHSIHRIDECASHPHPWMATFKIFLFASIFSLIPFIGLVDDKSNIIWMGILWGIITIITGVVLAYTFTSCMHRYVNLQGTFGKLTLQLPRNSSRELVAHISEMIYHRKMRRILPQAKWSQQTSLPVTTTSTPVYYTESEKRSKRNSREHLLQ